MPGTIAAKMGLEADTQALRFLSELISTGNHRVTDAVVQWNAARTNTDTTNILGSQYFVQKIILNNMELQVVTPKRQNCC